MKKITFLFLLLSGFTCLSQIAPINFEPGGNGVSWTWTTFENPSTPAPPLEIIANPFPSGINTSTTVAKLTPVVGAPPYAGVESLHGAGIGTFTLSASNSTVKIMVYKTVISDVGIKFVTSASGSTGEIKVANTVINQWEELVFDFSSKIGETNDQIVIFPDFQTRTTNNVCYFDNISFSIQLPPPGSPSVAAPTPTISPANVISMFSNAYTNVGVDTWRTSWSSATLTDLQIQGNDTKRYSSLDFVGIETTGANLIDASGMSYFHVDVWTPNMTLFRIKLVDFGANGTFQGGDDVEHELVFTPTLSGWNSYHIPLSDFTGLTTRAHIAQLIFSGNPAGSGIVYVDNVYFSSQALSSESFVSSSVKMYPNPVSNVLNFDSKEKVDSISITNVLGQTIVTKRIQNDVFLIDVSELAKGQYFINLTSQDTKMTKIFIKN